MATEHAVFEDTYAGEPRRAPKSSKYPWQEWFNGSVWEINSKEDFTCVPASMIMSIRNRAKIQNLSVRISQAKAMQGDKVFIAFQVSKKVAKQGRPRKDQFSPAPVLRVTTKKNNRRQRAS